MLTTVTCAPVGYERSTLSPKLLARPWTPPMRSSCVLMLAMVLVGCAAWQPAGPRLPGLQVRRSALHVLMEEPQVAAEPVSARKMGLALALDDGTRKSHSVAENTAFVSGFFRGIGTRAAFSQLVAALYFVYAAMETAFEASTDERVRKLDYPELRRRAALEADMKYYFGANWQGTVRPSAATKAYVERVEHIAKNQPELLVAHMYTRYLGDLFGGVMMGGMARKSLDLDPGLGTQFYEFDDIPVTKDFIEAWYTNLNELDLDDAQKQAIVDEGNLVFALNIDLFGELEGNALLAASSLALRSLRDAMGALWTRAVSSLRSVARRVLGRGSAAPRALS